MRDACAENSAAPLPSPNTCEEEEGAQNAAHPPFLKISDLCDWWPDACCGEANYVKRPPVFVLAILTVLHLSIER